MKKLSRLLLSTATVIGFASMASAADPELTVFDWAGFENQALIEGYVAKHGQMPTYSFFADDDEAFQKMSSGFKADVANHWLEETFEITLRNHKKESVSVRVIEHLFRWTNWQITQNSDPFGKKDAQTVEFRLPLKPDQEKKLLYKVRYSW